MSVKVLLSEFPTRSIALVTSSHALVFRSSPASAHENGSSYGYANPNTTSLSSLTDKNGAVPRIMVEFSSVSAVDLQDYRPISHPCKGTLGLITINGDVFICLVNGSTHVATVRPGEKVERIHAVQFHCLNRSDYDRMLELEVNSYPTNSLDEDGLDYGRPPVLEHPCLALKKLLSGGTFYYSTDFDLTNRLQNRSLDPTTFDIDNFDPSFLWNSFMISPLIRFRSCLSNAERKALDASHLLTSAIRGFVETLTIPHSSSFSSSRKVGVPATLTLISRLSCKRAGTRFNARGIDDEGNVANFVETETVIWDPAGGAGGCGVCFSYCQVRGSVPIFWEQQTGLLPHQQKIQLSRSAEATQPAFDKHFEMLTLKYGVAHVVNLLSATKPGEVELSRRFRHHIRQSPLNNDAGHTNEKYDSGQEVRGASGEGEGTLIRATEYDFHAETQGRYENANAIRHILKKSADGFAYFYMEDSGNTSSGKNPNDSAVVILQQEGIFRTNCLDCLDRTNLVQGILSQLAIESFLHDRGDGVAPDFWMRHSTLWADNGDALSRIYAGTGALKSSYTRHGKTSLGGLIADARKSATRMYINKFVDAGRQETIDILLGRQLGQFPVSLYDPINDYAQAELSRRAAEYSSTESIYIYVGTFNVNGKTNGINDDLSSWLCPAFSEAPQEQPEIVVVGFQEIVELSPQQIMSTDPAVRKLWEKAVLRCLNQNIKKRGGDEYILLRSGQLVGAALMIFVKSSAIGNIKNVEGSLKKTGMSGVAGNKGAVAIRMDYASTRLCFVTAHLAAGFSNYEERNRDYRTISHGLRFQRGRGIDDHDTIIWLGDFNYRIGLPNEKVHKLIQMGDLQTLYDNDQLNLQMISGFTFPYYQEALLTFDPTYKFDLGTDDYDTSEKARIPAWCDRILRKGSNLKQLCYNCAPLRFSDHRPVYATFQCTVTYIDEAKKEKLSREIYFKRRSEVGGSNGNLLIESMDEGEDEDLLLLDEEPTLLPGLPPPSSDKRKWWLDNGKLATSDVRPPGPDYIYNPNKPLNPFSANTELDWVKVDLTGASSYSNVSDEGVVQKKTPPPAPISRSNTSSTISVARRKLPPAWDPEQLPPLPPRTNTFTSLPLSAVTTPDRQPPETKHRILAPPPPPSQTSSYPQLGPNSSSTPARPTLPASSHSAPPPPPPPSTSRPIVAPLIELDAASPTVSPAASDPTAKKPPVPKKPTVLTKSPPQSSGDTVNEPAPPNKQTNKLTKSPPPLPLSSTHPKRQSSPPLPPEIHSTKRDSLSAPPARLIKPPPITTTSTQTSSNTSAVPLPTSRKGTTSLVNLDTTPGPPDDELPNYAESIKEKPPLPIRGRSPGEIVGVESKSQITNVRQGVARWEEVDRGR